MLATAPALADEPDRPRDPTQEMEQLAREAAEQLMFALSAMLAAIPQYEAPEVLPNGDIIIRRKLPEAPEPYEKQIRAALSMAAGKQISDPAAAEKWAASLSPKGQ